MVITDHRDSVLNYRLIFRELSAKKRGKFYQEWDSVFRNRINPFNYQRNCWGYIGRNEDVEQVKTLNFITIG